MGLREGAFLYWDEAEGFHGTLRPGQNIEVREAPKRR